MITCRLTRHELRLEGHAQEHICAVASVVTQALASYQGDRQRMGRREDGVTVVRRRRTDSFRFAVHTLRGLARQWPDEIRFEAA